MIYLILYLLFAVAVALYSINKRIGFTESLFISILLTPIIGFIIVWKAKKSIQTFHYFMIHKCTSCGNIGIQKGKECSICGNEIEVSFSEQKLTIA